MKKKEIKELAFKSVKELSETIGKLRKEIKRIMMDQASGKLKNVSLVREKKKDIARLLTAVRGKELTK
ncbi:50S ribosomal protein L29 [Candidatus Gottesmanbacteria bacterium RBG_13_37_7]|uniref:Large ribosomal subunit protein uL29 n=1 Tax=Candidatus Gottesmanbacteria bacterium RBG_13_37_7 TaxID=1798369 RepID=A0A1F5YIX3_9BACT|nr:MAG: 50S ribosomal protein L29 [Candidatus Gottesmanbacteria bacterium RBG_13_37_7]